MDFEEMNEDQQFQEAVSLFFPNAESKEEVEEELEHLLNRF